MKRMANTAEIYGEKTNHSAHKTMVTALTKHNVPETQIIQLTGHKSLNAYKKASMDQQKDMSHILSSYTESQRTPHAEHTPLKDIYCRK